MTVARAMVTMGCPCGVGPEVGVVAATKQSAVRIVLVGDHGAALAAAVGRGIDPARLIRVADPARGWAVPRDRLAIWQPTEDLAPDDRRPGSPTRSAGAAQLAWVDAACDRVAEGEADALVTGPVSKEQIVLSRAPGSKGFLGHTEHLQQRLHAREVVMAFWSSVLVTSLVTTHLPLARVPRALSASLVARATFWLGWLLARLSRRPPRIAVAALNPHAGEGGLLGHEERTSIRPGMALARARLAKAVVAATIEGPVPAETAFRLAVARRWDGVVAMYHDQATIPMKLVGFGEAVNVSLGLPIVRTSVDHGTAYDRAGKWSADETAMSSAIRLAAKLARAGGAAERATTSGAGRAPTRATTGETRRRRPRSA
jgi:4-hydroxythreonine-4-phosphate dehydrogenase